MGEILVGTSSWTDKTLLDSGWYPSAAKTPEQRLKVYASRFPLVEVDSTYYGMPSEQNSAKWVERTPPSFTFNIKAYSLLTKHQTEVKSLPAAIRHGYSKKTITQADVPAKILEMLFEMFASALMPLHSAGKLGVVLFQFSERFEPSPEHRAYIESCRDRLPDFRLAIEFRNRDWMADPGETFAWLRDQNLPYVAVDEPQGFPSSVPPVSEATASDVAVVRFHGRNTQTWKKRGITVAERFNYLYEQPELLEWKAPIEELAQETRRVHVLFNNCYQDNGVRNAKQMADLLGSMPPEPMAGEQQLLVEG